MTAQADTSTVVPVGRGNEFLPDRSYFAFPHACPGTVALKFTIGGIQVRVTGFDEVQASALLQRHGIFCRRSETTDRPRMEVNVRRVGRPAFLIARDHPVQPGTPGAAGTGDGSRTAEYYRIHMRWEAGALLATSYEWAASIEFAGATSDLLLADCAVYGRAEFDRSLENYLRVVYAHLAVPAKGFLLHSAGLVRSGRAFLFFGPSGAGKTTVTTLSPGAKVLSDDLTMVMPAEATPGAEARYAACSVPFRGLFAPHPESADTYPLAGLFRLVQDTTDWLEPLSGAAAIGEVVGSLPFVMDRPEMAGSAIDAVSAAAGQVPVFRLHFRKDSTFWRVIEDRIDGFRSSSGIKS